MNPVLEHRWSLPAMIRQFTWDQLNEAFEVVNGRRNSLQVKIRQGEEWAASVPRPPEFLRICAVPDEFNWVMDQLREDLDEEERLIADLREAMLRVTA